MNIKTHHFIARILLNDSMRQIRALSPSVLINISMAFGPPFVLIYTHKVLVFVLADVFRELSPSGAFKQHPRFTAQLLSQTPTGHVWSALEGRSMRGCIQFCSWDLTGPPSTSDTKSPEESWWLVEYPLELLFKAIVINSWFSHCSCYWSKWHHLVTVKTKVIDLSIHQT